MREIFIYFTLKSYPIINQPNNKFFEIMGDLITEFKKNLKHFFLRNF